MYSTRIGQWISGSSKILQVQYNAVEFLLSVVVSVLTWDSDPYLYIQYASVDLNV